MVYLELVLTSVTATVIAVHANISAGAELGETTQYKDPIIFNGV